MKIFKKKNIMLKEDAGNEKNYAADTSGANSTPSEIVAKTKAEHPDATSVTVPGNEIDGDTSTQTQTVKTGTDPNSLANATKLAKTAKAQGQNVNFEFSTKQESVEKGGLVIESVTFTKKELRDFLQSL